MNKAIIEIPKMSMYKYEQDKESKFLKLDRTLVIPCPYNYGFVTNTLSADGDPLDIFIVSEYSIPPLTEVEFQAWGILLCEDNGVEDNKVIGIIKGDLYRDYDYFRNIKFYLTNYKQGFIIKEYKIFNDQILFENFIKENNVKN